MFMSRFVATTYHTDIPGSGVPQHFPQCLTQKDDNKSAGKQLTES